MLIEIHAVQPRALNPCHFWTRAAFYRRSALEAEMAGDEWQAETMFLLSNTFAQIARELENFEHASSASIAIPNSPLQRAALTKSRQYRYASTAWRGFRLFVTIRPNWRRKINTYASLKRA